MCTCFRFFGFQLDFSLLLVKSWKIWNGFFSLVCLCYPNVFSVVNVIWENWFYRIIVIGLESVVLISFYCAFYVVIHGVSYCHYKS